MLSGVDAVPAKYGDYLTLYLTGPGPTEPSVTAGQLPACTTRVAGDVRVMLGGFELDPEDILYAGVAPGYAGLYQVNIQLTSLLAGYVPLTVRVDDVVSPPVTYLYMPKY